MNTKSKNGSHHLQSFLCNQTCIICNKNDASDVYVCVNIMQKRKKIKSIMS